MLMKKVVLTVAALSAMGLARAAMLPVTGTNTVGFVSVTAPASSNTIVTVPFEACLGGGAAGVLSDLVATNGLTSDASSEAAADQLVVLTTNGTSLVYYYYWLKTNEGWKEITSEQIMPDGSKATLTPPAATNFPVARGLGFWVKRVAGASSGLYLKGQVSSQKQSTQISPGLNLVGVGSVEAFTLNGSGIDWSGAAGTNGISSGTDKILVCNGDGSFTAYYYYVKREGASSYYDQFTNKWVESTSTGPALPTRTIQAGQGFWYHRRGAGSFAFHPDGQ
jgi:hypothetical protein